ncbi:MAG: hypothetical protein QNI84_10135 [Henriciella sp.]|nr:hypothetical protein [Henriciella sp.]
MNRTLKLAAVLFLGLAMIAPQAGALNEVPMDVAFTYDRSAPVGETYLRAKRKAERVCGIHSRVPPVRRLLVRDCVLPMLNQFVLKTGDAELLAHHEERVGTKAIRTDFSAY